jgi:transposase-like protein
MKEGQRCPMPRFAPHRSELVSPKMKKRWTVVDAQAVVARVAESGLSVREFAEAEGLEAQRIYRWRSVLQSKRTPAFVEVKRPAVATPIEVVLRTGHVVRVPDGFSEETLRRVMAVLSADGAAAC